MLTCPSQMGTSQAAIVVVSMRGPSDGILAAKTASAVGRCAFLVLFVGICGRRGFSQARGATLWTDTVEAECRGMGQHL